MSNVRAKYFAVQFETGHMNCKEEVEKRTHDIIINIVIEFFQKNKQPNRIDAQN